MNDQYVAAAETHTGAVLFLGDVAYKVKKPVSLGFVDWSDRSERLAAIQRELDLNRRLAPDVYLGTTELPRPGHLSEPALIMRRLPADRRLSTLVQQGHDVGDVLRQIAHQLATFHLAAPASDLAAAAAGSEELRRRWTLNHERLQSSFGRWVDGSLAQAVLDLALRYLAGRDGLLTARVEQGWARDGHGDLLADDIFCLSDGPRILDCLDFDEHLRVGDVLADVAFLAMDLDRLGRADLGWRFLELHRGLTGDHWPASLAHHHIAYRAQVRCLVSCVRAEQGDAAAAEQAPDFLELAARHLRAGCVRLILVGGGPATGKSTLATGLSDRFGVPVLRSDVIRKELAGLPPTQHAPADPNAGIYTSEWSERTYRELLHRARQLLTLGESVVLDATWLDGQRREEARRVASETAADLTELRCVVATEDAQARAAARQRFGGDVSDASGEIVARLAAHAGPWPEATEIHTDSSPKVVLGRAVAAIESTD